MSLVPRVAVLGGGLSGLSLAHFLRKELGAAAAITVFEASHRVGGLIESIRFPSRKSGRQYLFERGCRGISKSAYSLYVCQLIQDLQLEDEVIFIAPTANKRYIHVNDQMWPIPQGLRTLFTSPLVQDGVMSLFRDRFRSKPSPVKDETVADFFRSRFGDHNLEHLVDPVLTGTYGSDVETMSMAATFPQWYPLMQTQGSVISAMQTGTMAAFDDATKQVLPSEFIKLAMASPGLSFAGGTQVLVDTLAETLSNNGTDIWLNTPVQRVEQTAAGDGLLVSAGDETQEFTHVFSTLAAEDLRSVLPSQCDVARSRLREIDHTAFWVVNLGYASPEPDQSYLGVGYFTPSSQNSPVMRVLFDSKLFPQQATGPDTRISVTLGRGAVEELRERPVEEVANLAADTIAAQLNNPELSMPDAADAFFASRGYPQSPVGHTARIQDVRGDVQRHLPGMQVLGAGYDGPDVSYCVATAFRMAKELGRVVKLQQRQGAAASTVVVEEEEDGAAAEHAQEVEVEEVDEQQQQRSSSA